MRHLYALYRELLAVAPPSAARFAGWYSVSLGLLSILDAAALGLFALLVGPLAANGTPTLPLVGALDSAGVLWLLGMVCLLIVLKGVAASILLWVATRRFGELEREIGARLFRGYVSAPWKERLKKNSSDIVRLSDSSVTYSVSGYLLPGSMVLGEVLSLVAILVVLAIAAPLTALITLLYVGLLGLILYFWIARNARVAGRVNLVESLRTSRLITEMVGALKELTLRGKRDEMMSVVDVARRRATHARANIQFLGQVPRFVLESGLIGGIAIVAIFGFLIGGTAGALTSVALFGLAGFRMTPAIIRLQAITSQLASNAVHPRAIIDEIRSTERTAAEVETTSVSPLPAHPKLLTLDAVSYTYEGGDTPAVRRASLTIPFGSTVAFVGASGSGKSTMIDLILGLLEPTEGSIRVDGIGLPEVRVPWRRHVGYVPQEVSLFDTTIGQNVALTWTDDYDRDRAAHALERAQLGSFVATRAGGLDSPVGERGISLSGGQRQRLGIARALYADPFVLVLDEATSALDTSTEAAVTSAIGSLRGETTVIIVAHRLATIQRADRIFFMAAGEVQAQGTFDELVRTVPDFALQASLAGLT